MAKSKKVKAKAKPKAQAKVTETPPPPPPSVPNVDVAFKRPDPEKGILNSADGSPVNLIVLKGREFPTDGNGTLIYLQNGRSTDFLTPAIALTKFHQDAEGQVYYSVSGFVASELSKPVDVLELVD